MKLLSPFGSMIVIFGAEDEVVARARATWDGSSVDRNIHESSD
jgi:hypothetical protein